MSKSSLSKRKFYNQPDIAQTYHEQRFGGASDAWVNAREIELALQLLPVSQRVLDLGCGTGRMTRALAGRTRLIGVDAANAMLALAHQANTAAFVQGDAFALPFEDASFDSIVALRLVFHFAQLDSLLREMQRVVAPGGVLVFDTYLWSPRAWFPLDQRRWGSGVFIHPARTVEQATNALGLQIRAWQPCFLFSPYLYRRLPLRAVQWLERIEPRIPEPWRARAFWKIVRPA